MSPASQVLQYRFRCFPYQTARNRSVWVKKTSHLQNSCWSLSRWSEQPAALESQPCHKESQGKWLIIHDLKLLQWLNVIQTFEWLATSVQVHSLFQRPSRPPSPGNDDIITWNKLQIRTDVASHLRFYHKMGNAYSVGSIRKANLNHWTTTVSQLKLSKPLRSGFVNDRQDNLQ